jgi:vacuolar protein sorting-associated protein 26
MAGYFFAQPIDIEVRLEGEDERKQVESKADKEKTITCPVYYDGDSITGQVCPPLHCTSLGPPFTDIDQVVVRVRDGKKLVHDGIKVEFVGSIGARHIPILVKPVN